MIDQKYIDEVLDKVDLAEVAEDYGITLKLNPHCSYISANPLIPRTRFFDIRILGPHKFSCLYRNVVHLERVVYL